MKREANTFHMVLLRFLGPRRLPSTVAQSQRPEHVTVSVTHHRTRSPRVRRRVTNSKSNTRDIAGARVCAARIRVHREARNADHASRTHTGSHGSARLAPGPHMLPVLLTVRHRTRTQQQLTTRDRTACGCSSSYHVCVMCMCICVRACVTESHVTAAWPLHGLHRRSSLRRSALQTIDESTFCRSWGCSADLQLRACHSMMKLLIVG